MNRKIKVKVNDFYFYRIKIKDIVKVKGAMVYKLN